VAVGLVVATSALTGSAGNRGTLVANCHWLSKSNTSQPEGRECAQEFQGDRVVTSAARSERLGKEIALGYVKRGFNTPGANLDAFASKDSGAVVATPVELVPLPFR